MAGASELSTPRHHLPRRFGTKSIQSYRKPDLNTFDLDDMAESDLCQQVKLGYPN